MKVVTQKRKKTTNESKIRRVLQKKKCESNVMPGHYIRNIDV
jgi:hypothetical protein